MRTVCLSSTVFQSFCRVGLRWDVSWEEEVHVNGVLRTGWCGGDATHDPMKASQHERLSMWMQRGRRRVTAAAGAAWAALTVRQAAARRGKAHCARTRKQGRLPLRLTVESRVCGWLRPLSRVLARSRGAPTPPYAHESLANGKRVRQMGLVILIGIRSWHLMHVPPPFPAQSQRELRDRTHRTRPVSKLSCPSCKV